MGQHEKGGCNAEADPNIPAAVPAAGCPVVSLALLASFALPPLLVPPAEQNVLHTLSEHQVAQHQLAQHQVAQQSQHNVCSCKLECHCCTAAGSKYVASC